MVFSCEFVLFLLSDHVEPTFRRCKHLLTLGSRCPRASELELGSFLGRKCRKPLFGREPASRKLQGKDGAHSEANPPLLSTQVSSPTVACVPSATASFWTLSGLGQSLEAPFCPSLAQHLQTVISVARGAFFIPALQMFLTEVTEYVLSRVPLCGMGVACP